MKFDLDLYAEGAVMIDGFEDCIIGVVDEFKGPRILYSYQKILQNLMEMGMTRVEAEEYFGFNILGLYGSEQNAVFLITELTPVKNGDDWEYHEK